MTSHAMTGSDTRAALASVGVALALTIAIATSVGAADAAEDSFCDAVTIDALHELSPLRFDQPDPSGPPGSCTFEASSPVDSYSLAILSSGISFDLMRQAAPDLVEFTIGGHPALMMDGYLHVGLDDGILSVVLTMDDPEAVPGLDPVALATGVAEMVLPAIDATSSAGADAASDAVLAPPPAVDGIEWGRIQEAMSAQALMEADESQAALWQPLADAVGADPAGLFFLSADGSDVESGEGLGSYSAIRATGVDEASLRSGIVDWFRNLRDVTDVETEDLTLAGRQVTRLSSDGQSRGILHVVGDTAYVIAMSDDDSAKVLQALP